MTIHMISLLLQKSSSRSSPPEINEPKQNLNSEGMGNNGGSTLEEQIMQLITARNVWPVPLEKPNEWIWDTVYRAEGSMGYMMIINIPR